MGAEIGLLEPGDARFASTLANFERCGTEAMHEGDSERVYLTTTLLWYAEALRATSRTDEARKVVDAVVRVAFYGVGLPQGLDVASGKATGNTPFGNALLALVRVVTRLQN